MRNTFVGGRRAGFCTVAGVQLGVAAHSLLAVAGLSALVYSSPVLFRALAVVGACYLAYLGWQTARAPAAVFVAAGQGAPPPTARAAFWHGMLCNVFNPKVLLLFIALMPGFVDVAAPLPPQWQLLVMSATLLALNIPFQSALVAAAKWFSALFARPRAAKITQWILGGVLMFFAAGILFDHVF